MEALIRPEVPSEWIGFTFGVRNEFASALRYRTTCYYIIGFYRLVLIDGGAFTDADAGQISPELCYEHSPWR